MCLIPSSPGKFEGEPCTTEWLYRVALDGFAMRPRVSRHGWRVRVSEETEAVFVDAEEGA
jgi:hypothetical protein